MQALVALMAQQSARQGEFLARLAAAQGPAGAPWGAEPATPPHVRPSPTGPGSAQRSSPLLPATGAPEPAGTPHASHVKLVAPTAGTEHEVSDAEAKEVLCTAVGYRGDASSARCAENLAGKIKRGALCDLIDQDSELAEELEDVPKGVMIGKLVEAISAGRLTLRE